MEKTFEYSKQRTQCPKCGSGHGFAKTINIEGGGKCFACGAFIPPPSNYVRPSYEQRQKYTNHIYLKSTLRLMYESLEGKDIAKPDNIERVAASNFIKQHYVPTSDISFFENKFIELQANGLSEFDAKFQSGYYAALWHDDNGYHEFNTKIYELYQSSPALAFLVSCTKPDILFDWFIDLKDGKVRYWYLDEDFIAINNKFIKYDAEFKRDKSTPPYYLSGAKQILFGLHQINVGYMGSKDFIINHDSDVFLFESEKNAVIASAFFKDKICLATGGAKSLTTEKATALHSKNVFIIFDSDIAGAEGAEQSYKNLKSAGANPAILSVSDFIQDLPSGYDIADYFINLFKEFIDGK